MILPPESHPVALPALAHATVLLAGLLLYVVATRVRHQRHHPSAAFAWVILIALLPYLGIPLFLLFGTSKLPRPRRRPGRPLPAGACIGPSWACALLAGLGLSPPTGNRSVFFHADGKQAACALLAMIDRAKRRILLSTFIFRADDFGNTLAAALAARARAGVQVCVLLDALARVRCGRGQLRAMREAVIIDDAVALCGSTNLDGRSLFLNFDMIVAFYGREEIDWLAAWVARRAALSTPYRARDPSWLRDLGEGLVRVIGFQL